MAPLLAFVACCGLLAWLFREDMKWRRLESGAMWIPGIWVAIAGSRAPMYWTAYLGLGGGVESNVEGSPVNFLIATGLIAAAMYVLRQRGLNLGAVVRENKAIFLIYLFFAASAFWSEYPLVSLRRLIKDVGAIAVALLLLTERDPGAAIRTVCVRVSFILFSFSVLFYKWFPELGRTYTKDGEPMFSGVATQKNQLGQAVMVLIIILVWDWFELWKQEKSAVKKRQVIIHSGCLFVGVWLLLQAKSQTSLVCLLLGLLVWWAGGYLARLRTRAQVVQRVVAVGVFLVTFNALVHPSKVILEALGRDPTLTGRAENWPIMIELCKDPLFGTGYRMYWDVEGAEVEARTGFAYPTAHNGYLETYLSGGLLGLGLLGIVLLATLLRTAGGLPGGGNFGRLGFSFWVVLLVYNWTESCFLWGGFLWFTFLLWAVKPPPGLPSAVVLPSPDSGYSFAENQEFPGWHAGTPSGQA
jgi:O-antigen ligase